ncbi:zinc-binding alcohol dehydrogenase family protein [Chloroflexi bacterium TSY]|nr:zinc-binding alcohol dehydrogenase family protein [Chloroflexi bacterium TSY]
MKTVILSEPGHLELTNTSLPEQPGPGEALLRIHRVGICGTDLHAFRGRQPYFTYPRILGHELGTEVIAIGEDVTNVHVGDRCAVEPYWNCGTCIACRRGKTNCCTTLQTYGVHTDGGMREQILVPAHKLHKSETLPLDHLATVEMLCIGAHAVRRAQLEPGENVLVIGVGPIGLGVAQFALIDGANVIAMDINEQRMGFCEQNLGVKNFVDGRKDDVAQLEQLLDGDMPTVVFDATGSAQSMMNAFNLVAHGGKLVMVGLVQDDITFSDPYLHSHEMTILSSRNAMADDFRWVIKNLENGSVNIAPWITHYTDYDSIVDEFPGWLQPETGVVKAMLKL